MPLIALANRLEFNRASKLVDGCRGLSVEEVAAAYERQRATAPHRHLHGKKYLSQHTRDGITSSGTSSNREEEHLAVALWHASRAAAGLDIGHPTGERLVLVDYQTPLKARRADTGVGKIDLLGLIGNRLAVVELKRGSGRDTPLRALLEGLAYCAIVESNLDCIRQEVRDATGTAIVPSPPVLVLAAPESYWAYWERVCGANYLPAFERAASTIARRIGVEILCLGLLMGGLLKGLAGSAPRISGGHSARILFRSSEEQPPQYDGSVTLGQSSFRHSVI